MLKVHELCYTNKYVNNWIFLQMARVSLIFKKLDKQNNGKNVFCLISTLESCIISTYLLCFIIKYKISYEKGSAIPCEPLTS